MSFEFSVRSGLRPAAWFVALVLATEVCCQAHQEDIILLSGTVLSDATDVPIAGVTVIAFSQSRTDGIKELGAPIQTDRDGRWAIRVPRPVRGQLSVSLRLLSRDFGSVAIQTIEEVTGDGLELPPIHLEPGVRVRGRIVTVDSPEAPIRKPRFEIVRAHVIAPNVDAAIPEGVSIGSDGVFELPWAVVPGQWTFSSESHVPLGEPFRLGHKQSEAFLEIRLTVGQLLTVKGIVVDQKHQPLADVRVLVKQEGSRYEPGTYVEASTDDLGRFHLVRRFAPHEPRLSWRLSAHLNGYMQVGPSDRNDQIVSWSDESVHVVMRRERTVSVRAARADTGEALSKFSVHGSYWHEGSQQAPLRPISGAQAVDGIAQVENRQGWSNRILLVRPEDPLLAPSGVRLIRTTEAVSEVVFTLGPAPMRAIVVRDEEGQPIPGAQVVASLRGNAGLGKVLTLSGDNLNLEPEVQMQLTQGTTNASGEFKFHASNDVDVFLEASHLGYLNAELAHLVDAEGSPPQTITLQRGAGLTGNIGPKAWLDRYHAVREQHARRGIRPRSMEGLHLIREEQFEAQRGTTRDDMFRSANGPGLKPEPSAPPKVKVDRDGVFRIAGIPNGNWILVWDHITNPNVTHSRPSEVPLAGPMTLRAGAAEHVVIDMSAHLPVRVSASLTVNKEPHPLIWARWHGWGMTPLGTRHLDADLETARAHMWALGELLPGSYYLQIEWGIPFLWDVQATRSDPIFTTLPARITVSQGGPAHFDLEAQIKRDLKLKLSRETDGQPVVGAHLFRRFADDDPGEWLVSRWTSSAPWSDVCSKTGEFPLHTLAAGIHRIYIPTRAAEKSWPKGPTWTHLSGPNDPRAEDLVFIGTIEVTADEQTFELKVPESTGW